ncbi:YhcN/YlaJ family sporulation lipoprotein [Pontibacillus salicampi]|uniref:YhcN/YlaJ family sporulation lipoprotein n=1 Tax=Pontibacillus salicampi TaxID=1449801 RepID=A0ABV6LJB2_9BACI
MIQKLALLGSILVVMSAAGCGIQEESIVEPDLQPESLSTELDNMSEEKMMEDGQSEKAKNEPSYTTNEDSEHNQYELNRARQKSTGNEYPKKNTPKSDPHAMSTNNKDYDQQSRTISKRLAQSRFVMTAQVVVTNDTVVVAVEEPSRATYTRVDVAEKVRKMVREMPEVKGKEVVIYTDERYWDRMKDLKSRIHQDEEMPEGIDQHRDKNYR